MHNADPDLALPAAKYNGEWHLASDYSEVSGDAGLKMASPGKLHAMAAPIEGGLAVKDSTIVVQYEVTSCPSSVLSCTRPDSLARARLLTCGGARR